MYIYSTDVEYAQFYNKEISLRVNLFLNDLIMDYDFHNLRELTIQESDLIFGEIENKKIDYFSTQNKELSWQT